MYIEIHKTPCLIILAGIKSGKRSRQVAELFGIIKTCDAHCIARAKGLSSGGTLRKVLISRFCGLASKQQYLQLSQQNKQGICDHVLTSSNHQAGSQTNTQRFLHSASPTNPGGSMGAQRTNMARCSINQGNLPRQLQNMKEIA